MVVISNPAWDRTCLLWTGWTPRWQAPTEDRCVGCETLERDYVNGQDNGMMSANVPPGLQQDQDEMSCEPSESTENEKGASDEGKTKKKESVFKVVFGKDFEYWKGFDLVKKKERCTWSPEEDAVLQSLVEKHGTRKWTTVSNLLAQRLPGSNKDNSQCSQHWRRVLCPRLRTLREQRRRGNRAIVPSSSTTSSSSGNDSAVSRKKTVSSVAPPKTATTPFRSKPRPSPSEKISVMETSPAPEKETLPDPGKLAVVEREVRASAVRQTHQPEINSSALLSSSLHPSPLFLQGVTAGTSERPMQVFQQVWDSPLPLPGSRAQAHDSKASHRFQSSLHEYQDASFLPLTKIEQRCAPHRQSTTSSSTTSHLHCLSSNALLQLAQKEHSITSCEYKGLFHRFCDVIEHDMNQKYCLSSQFFGNDSDVFTESNNFMTCYPPLPSIGTHSWQEMFIY